MNSTQEELFKNLISLKYNMQQLAGYVQNDIEEMLLNDVCTKEDIKISISEAEYDFDCAIEKLQHYKKEVLSILKKHTE